MEDIAKFITGFKRFQKNYFGSENEIYIKLQQSQHPKALVIACCDSRTDPAILTDCEPGDLFVVRNVANLVPPYERDSGYHGVSASLEFAVCHLNVSHVIVLGHANCGGIRTLWQGLDKHDEFLSHWMEIAQPARDLVQSELASKNFDLQLSACEQASILISLENLMTFPWIAQRVNEGKLALHGWYFNLECGELWHYSPVTAKFEVLVSRCEEVTKT